jgi:hypothetical protein
MSNPVLARLSRARDREDSYSTPTWERAWASYLEYRQAFLDGRINHHGEIMKSSPSHSLAEQVDRSKKTELRDRLFANVSLISICGGFLLALAAIGAGVWLTYLGVNARSKLNFFGVDVDTGSVGIAALAIGIAAAVMLARRAIKFSFELASGRAARKSD